MIQFMRLRNSSKAHSMLELHNRRTKARRRVAAGAARRPRAARPGGDRLDRVRAVALAVAHRGSAATALDQRRADHDAVGAAAIALACSAVLHAEADRDRQAWCARLMRATAAVDFAGVGRGRAGDAGDRDVVDKARRIGEHRRQALVVGRRRREADEVEAGLRAPAGKARRPPPAAGRPRSGRRRRPPWRRRGICRRRRCRSGCSSPSARSGVVVVVRAEGAHQRERLFHGLPGVRARAAPAAWMAGPSAIGSVNGMPSSITSAPAFGQRLERWRARCRGRDRRP